MWSLLLLPCIRRRYPVRDCPASRLGLGSGYNGASRRGEPMPYRPYSEECYAAMQSRILRGESVKQAGDATLDGWRPTADEARELAGR